MRAAGASPACIACPQPAVLWRIACTQKKPRRDDCPQGGYAARTNPSPIAEFAVHNRKQATSKRGSVVAARTSCDRVACFA